MGKLIPLRTFKRHQARRVKRTTVPRGDDWQQALPDQVFEAPPTPRQRTAAKSQATPALTPADLARARHRLVHGVPADLVHRVITLVEVDLSGTPHWLASIEGTPITAEGADAAEALISLNAACRDHRLHPLYVDEDN